MHLFEGPVEMADCDCDDGAISSARLQQMATGPAIVPRSPPFLLPRDRVRPSIGAESDKAKAARIAGVEEDAPLLVQAAVQRHRNG